MTNIHPFTTAAACILTAGAALFTSSCQPASPESYARQFATAQHVSVHGYNGRETLTSRVYADWGSMPANARRAMEEYIKGAEWKTMDYIRPQYFIQVDRSFWAICIDNDGNMILTEGLVLQDEKIWKKFLGKDIIPKSNSCELYFEEQDIEAFVEKLERSYPSIQYVNKLMTHSWGQKVIRFYDLDGNLIEVGTPM